MHACLTVKLLQQHSDDVMMCVHADVGLPKLGPISAHRHRRTMSSELSMTPRRAPESPMGSASPSMGSPASENKPKPWPGVVLYGNQAQLICITVLWCYDCTFCTGAWWPG